MQLFDGVSYYICDSIPEHPRRDIVATLDANGATEVALDCATHIVSDTIEFDGADTLLTGAPCVTPYWVTRSMELGMIQDPKYFSADKDLIFSGIVATSADIPSGDKEVIVAGIKESGGQWREGLTRDVTHLFVTNTSSEKYKTAMHFRESAHIIVLLPQWFDQCWSMQMRLPHDVFEFPDPLYMRKDHDAAAYKAQIFRNDNTDVPDKLIMFRTMQHLDASSSPAHPPAPPPPPNITTRDVWRGRVILLSESLSLDTKRRESVETRISRNGGKVIYPADGDEDETTAVGRADVLVTQYRMGPAYARALAEGRMIGTLAWLFYVERSGVVSSPRDRLLHYPAPHKPIEGFTGHEITVTNYSGDEREYIKKLIEVMGAKFTPTMSGRNTIVIAAYKGGNKTAKADEWSVPIVTHKWLEDCFVEWRNLTPAQKKYLDYAPGVNYGAVLGERGVGHIGLEEDAGLLLEKDTSTRTKKDAPVYGEPTSAAKKIESAREQHKSAKKDFSTEVPPATATSQREALEVDEVEDVLNVSGDMEYVDDVDKRFTPKKIGPPRGAQKTPAKSDTPTKPKPKAMSKPDSTANAREQQEDTPTPSRRKGKEMEIASPEHSNSEDSDEDVSPEPKPRPKTRLSDKGRGDSPTKTPTNLSRPKPRPAFAKRPGPPSGDEPRSDEEGSAPESVNEKPLKRKLPIHVDDDATEDGPRPKPRHKPKPAFSKNLVHSSEDDDEDEDEHGAVVVKKKPTPRKALKPADNDHTDEDLQNSKLRPKLKLGKAKARENTSNNDNSDEDAPSRVVETLPRVVNKSPPKTYKSKAKEKLATTRFSDSQSDDNVQQVFRKKSGKQGSGDKFKVGLTPSPTRIVSVELPDPRDLLNSLKTRHRTPERRDSKSTSSPAKSSPMKPKQPARTTSLRAAAFEAPTPKRGAKHNLDRPRSPSPPPQRTATTKSTPAISISRNPRSSSPPHVQRTPSRRSAAAAASARLRDKVMPDVINYEKEIKRGARGPARRRKTSSTSGLDDEESGVDEIEAPATKKRKVAPTGKGKAKGASKADDSDDQPAKFVTHVRSNKRSAPPTDDEDEPGPSKPNSASAARKKVRMEASAVDDESDHNDFTRRSSMDPKKIRILKTKVEVREEVCKALMKLGVKFTDKPAQCTHLVASSFARTEKFLCAISNVPFVLTTSWILESSAKQTVLAESDYLLKDPAMEAKHNFKLIEALERARALKENKEKLLQGQFFYFTPKVSADFNLMKNVIQTNGGECVQKIPTTRNLSSTRHIVSCSEDEKHWKPLATHGYPIYSQELILSGALAQFVDWDDESKRVPGSR